MKKLNLILLSAITAATLLSSCKSSSNRESTAEEVKINNQVWMTKNLNLDQFRNGDQIPYAETSEEWVIAASEGEPAWCYYNNDPANGEKYGKLYNWYAVNDPRGLAPTGWHIPSDAEWTALLDYLGNDDVGNKLKSSSEWSNNGNGTNESGFSGLPGGSRDANDGDFNLIGQYGGWWANTEVTENDAVTRSLDFGVNRVYGFGINKGRGLSVRCLKD